MKKGQRLMTTTIFSVVWTLALTALVTAQQPASPGQPQSMDDMRQGCRTHCQATTTSIDQLTKQIEEARQSNDPAQMRAALDAAQKPLTEMKDHMGMCMNMMSMMQNMPGGMGGHMGGMMKEKGPASGSEGR